MSVALSMTRQSELLSEIAQTASRLGNGNGQSGQGCRSAISETYRNIKRLPPGVSSRPFRQSTKDHCMKMTSTFMAAIASLLAANGACAASDPAADLLATFTGDRSIAVFDILSSDVTFDAGTGTFLLHAHTAGRIADVASAAYVFGFNRGGAAGAPFAGIGVPGVSFDAAVLLRSDGTGTLGGTPLVSRVDGNDIFATVSASLLSTTGFAPEAYTWALWSIDTAIIGNTRNADFAPDGNLPVATIPEPETYALLVAGLGGLAGVIRRRSRAFVTAP